MTGYTNCQVNHILLDSYRPIKGIYKGREFTIKCCNRLCYESKLKGSDYCLKHHLRDEHN